MTFLGRFRSVRSRFLAVYVPLVVVAGAVVLAGYAYLAGRAAEKALDAKLDRVLTAQAKVANQPLWELDVERLELIAKAIAVDRDIAGVAFADEAGGQVVAVGTPAPVDFEGDDEIGRVVRAFNRTRAGGDNDGGS